MFISLRLRNLAAIATLSTIFFSGLTPAMAKTSKKSLPGLEHLTGILEQTKSDDQRFQQLRFLARAAFARGYADAAGDYAQELLSLSAKFQSHPHYSDSVHYANVVLGHLALDRGKTTRAKSFLLRSVEVSSSRLLSYHGPDLSLAQRLLKEGETATVMVYLERCVGLWKEGDVLDGWMQAIRTSGSVDFDINRSVWIARSPQVNS